MFETAFAQLRYAASVLFAIPFDLRALDRLVEGILATQHEFGTLGTDSAEFLGGPELDEESRREIQLRRFRTQALRAVNETDYYKQQFDQLGIDPANLKYEDTPRIPITPKEALRSDPEAFVRRGSQPAFRTTTTGTTGKPTSVYFTSHEIQATGLLTAITFLQSGQITPEDIVQISTSSRATLGNTCFSQACQRIGAVWYQTGLVDPTHALMLLSEEHHLPGKKSRASFLNTYASYLGELVEYGLSNRYSPADFGLERISVGGEIVTEGLKKRCQKLFGSVEFIQGYAMTETWPFSGTRCAESHLHFEPSQGLMEVLDPDTHEPVKLGEFGTIVATPFPPYREASVVLRYDTEDVVQAINGPLTCNLKHWPATSDLQGKLRLSVRGPDGWAHPRQVREALEAIEEVPLPARCGFWSVPGGVAVEVLVRKAESSIHKKIEQNLEEHSVPIKELHLVENPSQLKHPLPLRCDLKEALFTPVRRLR
ncbi:MAG TPA: AMP-binding protein [Anaerolineales bacterium]|nr:AMP-binding protein [Anaerolineales bacterium]